MQYTSILIETRGRVGLVTLNRPEALNAINYTLISEVMEALADFDKAEAVGAMVITGSAKAFAAGADIKEMVDRSAQQMYEKDPIAPYGRIRTLRKPIIAAVSGWALGGGCELAISCDMIVASETAKFGQPEINLGVMPGAGGTQRLTRVLGKAIAMEMMLNNRTLSAEEALRFGLINYMVPPDAVLDTALKLAEEIASRAPHAVYSVKRLVNHAYEEFLTEALLDEKKEFYNLFNSADQKEGMAAFVEKRKPEWTGK